MHTTTQRDLRKPNVMLRKCFTKTLKLWWADAHGRRGRPRTSDARLASIWGPRPQKDDRKRAWVAKGSVNLNGNNDSGPQRDAAPCWTCARLKALSPSPMNVSRRTLCTSLNVHESEEKIRLWFQLVELIKRVNLDWPTESPSSPFRLGTQKVHAHARAFVCTRK